MTSEKQHQLDDCLLDAINRNDLSLARYMIEKGADVNSGQGILLRRAIVDRKFPFLELLVDSGADINRLILGELTAMQVTLYTNNIKFARYLYSKGAIPPESPLYCYRKIFGDL